MSTYSRTSSTSPARSSEPASVGPPTSMARLWALSRATSPIASPRTSRLLCSTASSELENTTLGVARQIRANSTSTGVAPGSSPAVGQ